MAHPTKSLSKAIIYTKEKLYNFGSKVDTYYWQSTKIESPETLELLNHGFTSPIPHSIEELQSEVNPNLPWAEDHFKERVSGKPLNPGKEYKNWPFYKRDSSNDYHRTESGGKFSHSYMERIWPKKANKKRNQGIRYDYGDFNSIVELLNKDPNTRQAYLPIFFPEDTGCEHGERIPCSLGYHFIIRNNLIHVVYNMRSCDYLRHFRDDVYLACRKTQWLLSKLQSKNPQFSEVSLGTLTMYITSLHVFYQEKEVLKLKNN